MAIRRRSSELAGGDVAMMTSALLGRGPEHLTAVETGLRDWLAEHGMQTVGHLRGLRSQRSIRDPGGLGASQLHHHAGQLPRPGPHRSPLTDRSFGHHHAPLPLLAGRGRGEMLSAISPTTPDGEHAPL